MKLRWAYAALLSLALTANAAAPAAQVQTLPDFAAIVEANKGAVVNITASSAAKPAAAPELPEEFRNSPFGEFFRRYGVPQPTGASSKARCSAPTKRRTSPL